MKYLTLISKESLGVKLACDLKQKLRLIITVGVNGHVADENGEPENQVGGKEAVRINSKLRKKCFKIRLARTSSKSYFWEQKGQSYCSKNKVILTIIGQRRCSTPWYQFLRLKGAIQKQKYVCKTVSDRICPSLIHKIMDVKDKTLNYSQTRL